MLQNLPYPLWSQDNYCQLHHMDEFSVSTSKPPLEHCAVDKGWILRCVDGEFTGHTRLCVIIIYICHLKNEIKKKHIFNYRLHFKILRALLISNKPNNGLIIEVTNISAQKVL